MAFAAPTTANPTSPIAFITANASVTFALRPTGTDTYATASESARRHEYSGHYRITMGADNYAFRPALAA